MSPRSRIAVVIGLAACGGDLAACGGDLAGSEEPVLGTVDHTVEDDPGYVEVPAYDARGDLLLYLNAVRAGLALGPVEEDLALETSAQAHAAYLELHGELFVEPSLSAHGEDPALEGFTGTNVVERAEAAGYDGVPLGEVIAFSASSTGAARAWVESLYHRLPLLDPALDEVGYGETGDVLERTYNVLDLGRGSKLPAEEVFVAFPPNGATGVSYLWDGNEVPQPPPPPAGYPSGPVLTLQATSGTFTDAFAEVRPAGTVAPEDVLPATLLTPEVDPFLPPRAIAVIPHAPLEPETTYEVLVFALLDGEPTSRSWTFTTREEGCDVLDQDCGPGMGCYPFEEGPACATSGPGAVDAPCLFVGDCAAGLTCLAGRCRPLCDPTLGPSKNGSCDARCPYGVSTLVPDVAGVCLQPSCAFDASVCLEGETCSFAGAFLCLEAGTSPEGAACSDPGDCAPGLACLGIGEVVSCRLLCDGNGMPDCTDVCPSQNALVDQENPETKVRVCL